MFQADPRKTTADRIELRAAGDPGDVAFVVGVLRRQQKLIASTVAVFFLIGLSIYLFADPSYKAISSVLIDFKRLAALDENFSTETGRIDNSAVLSQVELLNSSGVVDRVVVSEKLDEDPEFIGTVSPIKSLLSFGGIAEDPARLPQAERRRLAAESLKKAVSAQRLDLSYAMQIVASAGSAEKAARIANAFGQAYIDDQLEAKREASEKASSWFSQRIEELQKDVRDADQNIVDYRLQNNIVATDGKFIDETRVADISKKLLDASFARAGAEAKVAQASELLKPGAEPSALVEEFSNEVVIKLRNAYLEESQVMADLSVRYGENHEAAVQARAKMAQLQSAINDEVARIQSAARTELSIARIQEETLRKEFTELSNFSLAGGQARIRLTQLESAAETVKAIRDTFMSRYVEGIQKQSFPLTEARIISKASTPEKPSFPTPVKTLGGSLVLGFGLGCLLGVASEAFSRKIRFRRQAETAVRAPCIGFLPALPNSVSAIALHDRDLKSVLGAPYVETLRGLKVTIDLRRQGKNVIVGFVSADVGEGKTSTAVNFAQICAASGAPTLLIDGNLRHSTISETFAANRSSGLADVLDPGIDLRNALLATSSPQLHLLPAWGQRKPEHPDTVLSAPKLRSVIRDFSASYTYIVIDLPALGAVSDARAVADFVDLFVMAIGWNRTGMHTVQDSLSNNPQIADRLVGSVLTLADLPKLVRLGEPSAKLAASYHE